MSEATTTPPVSIAMALVKAQRAVSAVSKDKRAGKESGSFSYKYVSTESIVAEARAALHGAGLALLMPSWEMVSGSIESVIILVHEESGESWTVEPRPRFPVLEGKGRPMDKAMAGALTFTTGYALRGLLQIPREDENAPDRRNDQGYEPRRRERPPERQQMPAPKPASDPPPPPADLPPSGVVRYGKHTGAKLDAPKMPWIMHYLTTLADEKEARPGADIDAHIAEVQTEIESRMAEEALSANEAASGETAEG